MDLRLITRAPRFVRAGGFVRGGLMIVAGAALLIGNVAGSCSSSSNVSQIDVPLNYTPRGNSAPPIVRSVQGSVKLYVAAAVDKRPDTNTIGRNTEDSDKPIPIMAAGRQPAEFLTDVLKQEAGIVGAEVVDSPAAATHKLETEIVDFTVTEDNTYQAQVRLRARLSDRADKQLWNGTVFGDSSNYGKSKNVMNYQQTISDATRQAVHRLLGDVGFANALASGPAMPAVVPPAPPAVVPAAPPAPAPAP